jgi:hypothetical protein
VERARHTTLADTSADAGVTDSATPRRAPAGTESAGIQLVGSWALRSAFNLVLSREIIALYLRSIGMIFSDARLPEP